MFFCLELGFLGLKDFRIILFSSRRDDRSVENTTKTPTAFRRNATSLVLVVAFLRNARCCGGIIPYQAIHPYGMKTKFRRSVTKKS